jgi:hypothetical protein
MVPAPISTVATKKQQFYPHGLIHITEDQVHPLRINLSSM